MKRNYLILIILFLILTLPVTAQHSGKNFRVSVYTRAYEVQKMKDPQWIDSTWQIISSQLNVDKIYLETHRDLLIVDEKTMKNAIEYFQKKGLEVAGGITYTLDEGNQFQTFCYTNQEQRLKAQEIIEYTASFFDEIILDDFFFTNCKCNLCVEAKGDRSWTDYRLELMTDASENLILGPAKSVNPNVKIIIKYPNWYEHFHELGFNLETEPALYDGVYTGTETRDDVYSNQHLQPYLSYLAFRYYNNLKPGKNGGGWVDTYGSRYYDRYAEQLWLTILAKAPEITLFDYRQMLYPLNESFEPGWKNESTSFDYINFLPADKNATWANTAEHSLDIIDKVAGKLGNPYGIKSYKPFHSNGEDFLQNYLGMIGIPIDLVSEFPEDEEMILLTEQAKKDPEIVEKIEQHLMNGNDVVITSGLLNALQERGIRNIVNLEYTSRKAEVKDFMMNRRITEGDKPVTIPQIQYYTNDSWEIVSGMDSGLGWPVLLSGKYGNGNLYLFTVPENFADLYNLPEMILDKVREILSRSLDFYILGDPRVSVFLYDNGTFVAESFNDHPVEINIVFFKETDFITDLLTGETYKTHLMPEVEFHGRIVSPRKYSYKITIPAHSFRAFKINN